MCLKKRWMKHRVELGKKEEVERVCGELESRREKKVERGGLQSKVR